MSSKSVSARLNEKALKKLNKIVDKESMTRSTYIRRLIMKDIEQQERN